MNLDEVDKGILYLLQRDARGITTAEMADRVGVSASTVRNRIENMEADGVIRGYHPDIDYDAAGLQLHIEFVCSAPNPARERMAAAARDVNGVISTREVLDGRNNVHVEAVGTSADDAARINDELSDVGLEVVETKLVKETFSQPFDHFGEHVVADAGSPPVDDSE